jgi:DNA recombination protein RmuC
MLTALLAVAAAASVIAAWLAYRAASWAARSERGDERLERAFRDELARAREESGAAARHLREEVLRQLGLSDQRFEALRAAICANLGELQSAARAQSDSLTLHHREQWNVITASLNALRSTLDERLQTLQTENEAKLEQMRRTVDEQLQGTLERRLGESFQLVSERLEQVYRGLGEMQALAAGVGDLKKALTNVRVRGGYGEVQLEMLLEQMLSPEQYRKQEPVTGTAERVDFAIKLPGRGEAQDAVWLPVDAKFPLEDYYRLVDAADAAALETAGKQLEQRLKACARDIKLRYVRPPLTTDFAIMFLSTEGLYAEALRRPGLAEALQRDFQVTIAGPATLGALLNSLQMGFRTLAIQQRSSEVWTLLGAVKTEFAKYGAVLEKVQKKLIEAANTMDDAAVRTRAIERRLRSVEAIPESAAAALLDANGEQEAAQERLFEKASPDAAGFR